MLSGAPALLAQIPVAEKRRGKGGEEKRFRLNLSLNFNQWYNETMKKIFLASSFLAIIAGLVLVSGGIWGISFTYTNVAMENITTPDDASIPGVPVRGPFTLKTQADIIRKHTLRMTEGKTFAEMPQQIPKIDADGKPIVGKDGKLAMTANIARDIWITATTLITALNFGILAYAFSAVAFLLGLFFVWIGVIFYALRRKY